MKKLFHQLLLVACLHGLNAQTDSLKKIRVTGALVETYFIGSYGPAHNYSKENFQKHIKNNELLNQDLSGYTNASGGAFQADINGIFSAKVFFDIKQKKRFNLEAFIGLRFGTSEIAAASYSKITHDTTGTYINTSNNAVIISVNENNYSYHYHVSSKKIIIPFGFNLTTNKNNRLWFAAGVELAPGFSFANVFSAFYDVYETDLLLSPSSSYDEQDSYSSQGGHDVERKYANTSLKGIGFAGYATVPLAMNLRLAKRIKFLKHLNLITSLAPGISYAQNKIAGAHLNPVINASLGFRYNW